MNYGRKGCLVTTPESSELLGTPKAEFLRSVRQALGRGDVPPAEPYPRLTDTVLEMEEQSSQIRKRLEENLPALLDKLAEMGALGGWNVHRASGVEEAIGYIESVARDSEATNVVRSAQDVFDSVPVDAALANMGLKVTTVERDETNTREALREEIRQSGIGITGADYALAETGSLVVLPRQGLSRLVSLVPPVHIALVRPKDILESLDDLFLLRRLEYHQRGGEMGSYLNFITGPSRTADIEMTIIEGVHGPKEVHMVILG